MKTLDQLNSQAERQRLVKGLDVYFSRKIRIRDGFRCVTCGRVDGIQCGHVFSRSSFATRWDERNAFAQCALCNQKHETDPEPLYAHCKKVHGEEVFEELQRMWNKPCVMSSVDLREMLDSMKV